MKKDSTHYKVWAIRPSVIIWDTRSLKLLGFNKYFLFANLFWSACIFAAPDFDARLGEYATGARDTFAFISTKASPIAKLDLLEKKFKELKARYQKDDNDFLAASYAGLYAAWRCQETQDLVKLNGFAQDSIPLLDAGVSKAKRFAKPKFLVAALKNRLEIYTNLPSAFGKTYITKQDIELVLQDLETVNPTQTERSQIALLEVRVLAITDRVSEAKARLETLKKDKTFDAKALAYELNTAETIVEKNAGKKP